MATRSKTTSDTVNSDGDSAAGGDQDISVQIDELKNDISRITERLSAIGQSGMNKAVSRGERAKAEGQERVQELLDEAYVQLSEIEKQVGSTVRRKPLQSLGLAAGIGFLAAMIMRR